MSASGVLRHRGVEAWLENTNGLPIALSASHGGDADISSNTISTWVDVTPRQFYTLRWRTCAGSNPRSALCKVYLKDGFHSVGSSKFCVSMSMMDERRKHSQNRTTKGWLNPPYNRFGCLRVRKRLTDDDTSKKPKTQSGILLLGSLRLEIRRVSGNISKDQVYWGEGFDGMGICVFDRDGIEVIDNAAQGNPPYIVFEFKFREDPEITRRITEENMENKPSVGRYLKDSQKSSTQPSESDCDSDDSLDDSDDDSDYYECQISKAKVKTVSNQDSCGVDITTQRKRSYDANNSMETINSANLKLHTLTSDSVPNKFNTSQSRPLQQDKVSTYPASSSLVVPVIGKAEGIPDITISSIEPSTHTSLPPLIPRGEIESNVKLVAPDSGLKHVAVDASQSKAAHPPSPPPSTTKDISHTDSEMILSTELAPPTREPSPANRTTITNPGKQTRCSESSNVTVDVFALALNWKDSDSTDEDAATSAAASLSCANSHNSPVPTTCETDSHIQTVCEPETGPRINEGYEVQQSESSKSGNRALTPPTTSSSEFVNADNEITPDSDIIMASDLELDGREIFESNPAIVELEKSSDIVPVELSISRKGKRKTFDRGDDTNSRVPAGDEGFKRRITMVEKDASDSDIEYIGSSWGPGKIRTKIIQTAVKMEYFPVKLENLASDSDILLTAENPKIKLEDTQLDRKIPIAEMMGNYDALERKKKELEEKLAKKIAATQMEIEELSRRLSD